MRRWRQRKECRGGPAEEERDRVCEQRPHPPEVASYAGATADDGGVSLGRKRTGEEDREKQ